MRYTSDIYELPLSIFMEIYTNDSNTIEFDGEDKGAASAKIINDYIEIVGSKQLSSEILNCNERMNLAMTVECMKACENMMKLKMYDEVRDILMKIGYSCKKADVMAMNARISALKSRAQYDLDKISKEKNEEPKEKPTKWGFINEVVAIGKYNKMHINLKEWTAGSYACLVRQTCDEIDELNRKKK